MKSYSRKSSKVSSTSTIDAIIAARDARCDEITATYDAALEACDAASDGCTACDWKTGPCATHMPARALAHAVHSMATDKVMAEAAAEIKTAPYSERAAYESRRAIAREDYDVR